MALAKGGQTMALWPIGKQSAPLVGLHLCLSENKVHPLWGVSARGEEFKARNTRR
jgi:hypothetical protein